MSKTKKILIGYDGSEQGDVLIEDLAKAGIPENAKAIVLAVAETWELPMTVDRVSSRTGKFVHPNVAIVEEHLKSLSAASERVAGAFASRIALRFPNWKITAESVFGKPAAGLIEKADKWSPDLLVVGSQGRSAIGRFILGSVSQKVLQEALCSVRISRKPPKADSTDIRVLVGVDGSKNSEKIIDVIRKRVWNDQTEIRLIAVDDPFNQPELGYLPWNIMEDKPIENDKTREWLEKVIDAPAKLLKSKGLNVSKAIKWGDAANMILTEAKEWEADSIIVGARGLGRIKRFLLGSVSSAVAAKANCSVEVIR